MTPNTGAAPVASIPQTTTDGAARSQVDGPRNNEESLYTQNSYGRTEESQYMTNTNGTQRSFFV